MTHEQFDKNGVIALSITEGDMRFTEANVPLPFYDANNPISGFSLDN